MRIFENTNYDFIRWRWHALALSALVVVGGVAFMMTRGGIPLGIDFTGGTIVVVKFESPVAEDAVRQALQPVPGEKVVQSYGDPADNSVLVRLPQLAEEAGREPRAGRPGRRRRPPGRRPAEVRPALPGDRRPGDRP